MTPASQSILLTLVGAVAIRLTVTDSYLNYVQEWIRWPLFLAGAVLVVLSLLYLLPERVTPEDAGASESTPAADDHGHAVSRSAWLLFLPALVVFLVSPPALGSYLAERSAVDDPAAEPPAPGAPVMAPLPDRDPAPVGLTEYFVRARYDAGETLRGNRVALTGFVSLDDRGRWYVTRFEINCCAADATVVRAEVAGAAAPARDQWVRVTGTWVEGSGVGADSGPPAISAEEVVEIEEPRNPYA